MLNKVILIGKIGVEPELRYFKDGSVITILAIITTEIINNIKRYNWHRVIINNKNKNLKKGMLVSIIGKIRTRKWLKNNKYNYITEIICEDIKIISQYREKENVNYENYNNLEKEEDFEKEITSENEENFEETDKEKSSKEEVEEKQQYFYEDED